MLPEHVYIWKHGLRPTRKTFHRRWQALLFRR